MIKNLFEAIETLISEHGSSTILRERVIQLREEFDREASSNNRLRDRVNELEAENDELKRQIAKKTIPDEFVEHRSILFRRLPAGNIQQEAYCPDCKRAMSSLHASMPLQCLACGTIASFSKRELTSVVAEIT